MEILQIAECNNGLEFYCKKSDVLERGIFFAGEVDGIPIVINLEEEAIDNQIFKAYLTYEIIRKIKISKDVKMHFYTNGDNWKEIRFSSALSGYKKEILEGEVYSFKIEVQNENNAYFAIYKNKLRLEIKSVGFEENLLKIIFKPVGAFKSCLKYKFLLKKRMSEKLWQYNDREIFLCNYDYEENNILVQISIEKFGKLNLGNNYYDFILRISDEFKCADYFCYLNADSTIEQEVYTYKNIFLKAYKSGGENLSFKINNVLPDIYIHDFMEDVDNIYIYIDEEKKENDFLRNSRIVLKKQGLISGQYLDEWKVDLKSEKGVWCLEVSKKEILRGKVQSANELWDIFVEKDDILYQLKSKKDIKTEYFRIDQGYEICFFLKKNQSIAVYTHEGAHYKNNKVNIAVLGTCFSRSVFKSTPYFNPDYKRWYNCSYTQFHSSIISLSAPRLQEDIIKLNTYNLSKEAAKYLPVEFEKNFFKEIEENCIEYILIDNYIDATRPIIKINDSYITYNKYLIKTKLLKDLIENNCEIIQCGTEEFFQLYEKFLTKFLVNLKSYIPETHILLLLGRFSYKKIDEKTNKIEEWPNRQYIEHNNMQWDRIDEIFLSKAPRARIIDMRNTRYLSDAFSPIAGGASPSHYQKYFYKEILDKINKIVLEDKLNGR